MKRSKKLYILLGVLVVACIATFCVLQIQEKKEQIENSDEIILELSADSVESLSWEYESETFSFHKEEGQWIYDEDQAFPVDEEIIEQMLGQFEEFGASFTITEVEDYGQYGLEDPICTIQMSTADQSYEIQLGNFSEMDSQRYVSIGDGNVYLVSTDPLDSFDAVLSDVIDQDETPSFDSVTSIQFAGEENYQVVYDEDSTSTYCADDVYFVQQEGESLPLDTTRVENYLSNISTLELTDYVTYNVSQEELEAYGLDEPQLTVSVDYTWENQEGEQVSDTFVLNISQDPEERAAAEESSDQGESSEQEEEITAYARVGESQIVYQISSDTYRSLMEASYDSLRHLEVLSAAFSDVNQIDISLEGADYTITSQGEGDERAYYYQEEELNISDFQSALEGLTADQFTEEQPTQKEEIRLTVHLDNEYYPEVEIQLYRYDGTYCLAVVDGQPISLVERSLVVNLIEAVNAIVLN